jgi:flagellar basal body-associated protein FliL
MSVCSARGYFEFVLPRHDRAAFLSPSVVVKCPVEDRWCSVTLNVSRDSLKSRKEAVMPTPIRFIDKALVIIVLFLVFIIAATTAWALLFREDPDRGETNETSETAANRGVVEQNFAGIGRLRAVLKKEQDKDGATVIIRVVFPYNAADRAFTEELVKNTGDFREMIAAYFAGLAASDPRLRDEAVIKTELLERLNARLRLGKIDRLFFSEFLIIE